MWRARLTKAALIAAALLVVLGGWIAVGKVADTVFRDDDTSVDACLEDASTQEAIDACVLAERWADSEFDADVFAECVKAGGGEACVNRAFPD